MNWRSSMGLMHLKVRTRIYCGFAMLAAIGGGVAGFGVYQLSDIVREVRRMDAVSGDVARVLETTWRLEAVRRAMVHYQLDTDDAALSDAKESESQAKE